jgi:transposase
LQGKIERKDIAEQHFSQKHCRFILATNQLDTQRYPAQKLLEDYNGQQSVERGFRFLKDPLFFTSSVFVKKPARIEALALIMALTLMVYTLAERQIRKALEQKKETVLNQKNKSTARPTFRWILQKFQGVHLVKEGQQKEVSNMTEERLKIIRLFGSPIAFYYLLL